jgi:hypothetical protein
MLGSEKKRIPVVVYLFSVIQIAVFIAELVKAGMCCQVFLVCLYMLANIVLIS